MAGCPRVAGRSERRVFAGGPEREFVEVALPDHRDAGGSESREHRRIGRRAVPGADLGCGGGRLALHVDQVFDGQRNAVQYPEVLTVSDFAVRLAGLMTRLVSQDGDEGIDLVVSPSDRLETLLDEVFGGHASVADGDRKRSD